MVSQYRYVITEFQDLNGCRINATHENARAENKSTLAITFRRIDQLCSTDQEIDPALCLRFSLIQPGCHVLSGSNALIAVAVASVVLPRSFWSGTPSWLTMNVMMPVLPYSAG